jgi:hypothetical protein
MTASLEGCSSLNPKPATNPTITPTNVRSTKRFDLMKNLPNN